MGFLSGAQELCRAAEVVEEEEKEVKMELGGVSGGGGGPLNTHVGSYHRLAASVSLTTLQPKESVT